MARKNAFKPNKGVLKRFRLTGTGKVMRRRAGVNHLLSAKSATRRRRLRQATVCPSCEAKRLRKMIGL
ncbi:MAG: 50S ribosomal protein L35 [Planctomycetota bacterium]